MEQLNDNFQEKKNSSTKPIRDLEKLSLSIELKQAKAQFLRQSFLDQKSIRLKKRSDKINNSKQYMLQEQLMLDEAKKLDLCEKMRTAEVNRVNRLQKILQKAHNEVIKRDEIAFINQLEEENRRLELKERIENQEMRIKSKETLKEQLREEKIKKENEIVEVGKINQRFENQKASLKLKIKEKHENADKRHLETIKAVRNRLSLGRMSLLSCSKNSREQINFTKPLTDPCSSSKNFIKCYECLLCKGSRSYNKNDELIDSLYSLLKHCKNCKHNQNIMGSKSLKTYSDKNEDFDILFDFSTDSINKTKKIKMFPSSLTPRDKLNFQRICLKLENRFSSDKMNLEKHLSYEIPDISERSLKAMRKIISTLLKSNNKDIINTFFEGA